MSPFEPARRIVVGPFTRSTKPAVCVETQRAPGGAPGTYVRTADDAIAQGSAPNAGFVVGAAGIEPATSSV